MKKLNKKLLLEFDILDDILDGFERAKNNAWQRIDDCKDVEEGKRLLKSYVSLIHLQSLLLRVVDVYKVYEAEPNDKEEITCD